MREKYLCIIPLMCLILAPTQSLAQEIGITLSKTELWLGEETGITCCFQENTSINGTLKAKITEPIMVELDGFTKLNDTHFFYSYKPPLPGKYTLHCKNETAYSNETHFNVAVLSVEILNYTERVYTDEGLKIAAKVYKEIETKEEINTSVKFMVFLGGKNVTLKNLPYLYEGEWIIETQEIPQLSQGNHTLKLTAIYDGRKVYDERRIEVLPAFEFKILSVSEKNFTYTDKNITVSLKAEYHGESVLEDSDIFAKLGSRELSILRTTDGFTFQPPDLSPGSYELSVILSYTGKNHTAKETINYMVLLQGEIRDAEGKAVSGAIKIENDKTNIETNLNNGKYLLSILPGNYDVEFETQGMKILFTNVPLDTRVANDIIEFDRFQKLNGISGINILSGFAVIFNKNFERVKITLNYDDSTIKNESEIRVYKCNDWNMKERLCSSEWKEIKRDLDTLHNRVSFETASLSGFVIGERLKLNIEMNTGKSTYHPGERIKVTGMIKSTGKSVKDADVFYTLNGTSGQTKTDSNGVFSFEIDAPEEEGKYILYITASKSFYALSAANIELLVERKKDLSIVTPLSAQAEENSFTEFEISVINTGQAVLHDLEISVHGIPAEWFTIEPKRLAELDAGKEIKLNLSLFPPEGAKGSHVVDISVKSDEINATESFALNIREKRKIANEFNQTLSENENKDAFQSLTSYLVSETGSIIDMSSLLISILVVFYIGWKMKDRSKTEMKESFANVVKQEVLKDPFRKKEKTKYKRRKTKNKGRR